MVNLKGSKDHHMTTWLYCSFEQAVTKNITADEPIEYLLDTMKDMEILDGDAILLSDLLVKLQGCADNVEVWLPLHSQHWQ